MYPNPSSAFRRPTHVAIVVPPSSAVVPVAFFFSPLGVFKWVEGVKPQPPKLESHLLMTKFLYQMMYLASVSIYLWFS